MPLEGGVGRTKGSPSCQLLKISGPLTVRRVEQLGGELRAALSQSSILTLDVYDAPEADLSFVQLVESARKTASRAGGQVKLARPAEGALLAVLERGGFLNTTAPERSAFWTQTDTGQ